MNYSIPGTVKQIYLGAFYYSPKLESVVVPCGVTSINAMTFYWCQALESATLSSQVSEISPDAFESCEYLNDIYYGGSEEDRDAVSGVEYSKYLLAAKWHYGCEDHHAPELIPGHAASCTGTGLSDGLACVGCGKVYAEQETLPPLGHELSYTIADAKHHDVSCSRCEHSELEDCSFAQTAYRAPTKDEYGYASYTCAYCGNSYSETIDKLESFKITFKGFGFEETQSFLKGTGIDMVEFPEVPKKPNFVGAWPENVVLNDEDIVIECVYTPIQSETVGDVEPGVDVVFENGVAKIRMSAFSETKQIKYVSENSKPLDIVLVVDQSGSMAERLGSGTKREALVSAATEFVNRVCESSVKNGVEHRIAIVGFAMGPQAMTGYPKFTNTEILTTPSGSPVRFQENLSSSVYRNALMPVCVDGELNGRIAYAISQIDASGATAADYGMRMAENIFAQNGGSTNDRLVVFLTDGAPTYSSDFSRMVAGNAIARAEVMRANGTAIYSIGVLNSGTGQEIDFLSSVCSEGEGYYIQIGDTARLESTFNNILTSTVYTVKSFDNLSFVNTVSKEFTLTSDQEQSFRDALYEKYGLANEDVIIRRNDDGTTTIAVQKLKPEELADGGYLAEIEFELAANEKAGSGGTYDLSREAGIKLDGGDEYAIRINIPPITVQGGRCTVLFTINGEPYKYVEYEKGERVVAPEYVTDGVSSFSGWDCRGITADDELTIIDATLIKPEFSVTWTVNGEKTVEHYKYGEPIAAPEVKTEGHDFFGWSSPVPRTMPAHDLSFTAILSAEHTHSYSVVSELKPSCGAEGKLVYECACGDSYEERLAALEHDYVSTTVVEDNESYNVFVCKNCGAHSERYLVQKQVGKGKNSDTTYVDFTLSDKGVEVQANGMLRIQLVLDDEQIDRIQNNRTSYSVIRVNEDGTTTKLSATVRNGILSFTTDHFCIFVVGEANENGDLLEFEGHEHHYVQNGDFVAPSCTTRGYTEYVCDVDGCLCSYKTYEDALGHTTERRGAIPPTCIEAGYSGDVYCTACGELISEGETIAAHGHTVVLQNARSATCTEAGYTGDSYCEVCRQTIEQGTVIDASGHKYVKTVNAASCTEQGYISYCCTVCGDEYVDSHTTPALGHRTVLQNAKAATCTELGYTGDIYCVVCKQILEAGTELAALGHEYVETVTAPSCTEHGYTSYCCTVCGDEFKDSYVEALGHKTELCDAKPAICTEEGYSGDLICTVCGETVKIGTAIPALGHKTELRDARPATCTEEGYSGDLICTLCGETVEKGHELAKTAHDCVHHSGKAPTCTEKGYEAYDSCKNCEYTSYKEIAAHGHSYVSKVTAPTATKQGYTTHTCKYCGDSYRDNYTDPTGGIPGGGPNIFTNRLVEMIRNIFNSFFFWIFNIFR